MLSVMLLLLLTMTMMLLLNVWYRLNMKRYQYQRTTSCLGENCIDLFSSLDDNNAISTANDHDDDDNDDIICWPSTQCNFERLYFFLYSIVIIIIIIIVMIKNFAVFVVSFFTVFVFFFHFILFSTKLNSFNSIIRKWSGINCQIISN